MTVRRILIGSIHIYIYTTAAMIFLFINSFAEILGRESTFFSFDNCFKFINLYGYIHFMKLTLFKILLFAKWKWEITYFFALSWEYVLNWSSISFEWSPESCWNLYSALVWLNWSYLRNFNNLTSFWLIANTPLSAIYLKKSLKLKSSYLSF